MGSPLWVFGILGLWLSVWGGDGSPVGGGRLVGVVVWKCGWLEGGDLGFGRVVFLVCGSVYGGHDVIWIVEVFEVVGCE